MVLNALQGPVFKSPVLSFRSTARAAAGASGAPGAPHTVIASHFLEFIVSRNGLSLDSLIPLQVHTSALLLVELFGECVHLCVFVML